MSTPKEKKQVVSFAISPATKAELMRQDRYTMFVAHAVEAALGICPLCHGRWPHKEDENGARETSSTKTNSDYHSVRP